MKNKLTVDELSNCYFIEVDDVNGNSNYFFDEDDYQALISCAAKDSNMLAYCLISDNIKILVNDTDEDAIFNKVTCIFSKYNDYFNIKHEKNNRAINLKPRISKIRSFSELLDVSKSIHIMPKVWLHHPHSSIRAYLYDDVPDFLDKSHISNIYSSAIEYFEFLKL